MDEMGEDAFVAQMEKQLADEISWVSNAPRIIQMKELIIKKQFLMKVGYLPKLMLGNRKFVRNHYVPEQDAFLTCFMNDELTNMLGYCIAKKSNLKVRLCSYLEQLLHGYCLTYKFSKLISLDHYEEG